MGLERGYTALNGDAESRNVGRIADRTAERLVVGSEGTLATRKKKRGLEGGRGGGRGRTRKVETTCRNNVRVFDLRHVTEPH